MAKTSAELSPYALRYWPLWLLMGLLWLLIQLPYALQIRIGKFFGRLAFYFASRERKIAAVNLQRCFPHLNAMQQKTLLKKSFMAMGMGLMETAFGWWGSTRRLKKLVKINGLENITKALQKNGGAFVFTPHFSGIHFAGRLMSLQSNFACMFLPPKNPVLRHISWRALQRHYAVAIPRDNARLLIKTLKQNIPVFYTPDTDPGRKGSVFVPFFNIPAATVTAPARFAHLTGAAVIPATYYRQPERYDIFFYPALENYPGEDDEQNAAHINQWLEKFIVEQPENYLWQYKRFKTRPAGEAKFYPRR